jgi:cytoskeletal protein CcmA (bactofilin family)
MTVEKKMIRSDIPGHNTMLTGTLPYGAVAPVAAEEHRRLTVGRDIVLSGEISSCEHLIIEGSVVAKTLSTQRLDILDTGSFVGNAEVKDATIAGRYNGKLVVTGRLSIKATAVLTGEIEYGALEIEAGSRLEARIVARPAAVVEDKKDTSAKAPVKDSVKDVVKDVIDGVKDGGVVEALAANDTVDKDKTDGKSDEEGSSSATTQERPGTFRRAVGF